MFARTVTLAAVALLSTFAIACNSPEQAPSEATATATAAAATTPSSKTAEQLVREGGDFPFELDDSSRVSSLFKIQCAFKATDCYSKIRAEGALEGVRFEKNAKGELVFVSYGPGETYHKGAFRITASTPTTVTIEAIGKDEGIHARANQPTTMTIEAHGDTVVMEDTVKGKLVYHRAK